MLIIEGVQSGTSHAPLRSMFKARKQIFVDLLGWDVPVIDGQFELDEFDTEHATYLVLTDASSEHLASARLLQTVRPHLLASCFSHLCEGPSPRDPGTMEITRFCLSRDQSAAERRVARVRLVSALVDYALANGIHSYVCVADMGWLQQILSFGWRCMPLGTPVQCGGKLVGALRIEIDAGTPALMQARGTYAGDQRAFVEPVPA